MELEAICLREISIYLKGGVWIIELFRVSKLSRKKAVYSRNHKRLSRSSVLLGKNTFLVVSKFDFVKKVVFVIYMETCRLIENLNLLCFCALKR